MKQKLADWASVAEIVSSMAVVVTLVILVLEVRDNTQVLRLSAYSQNLDSINDFAALISQDADSARIWGAFVNEQTASLDAIDMRRLTDWAYILFRNYEKAYFSEQTGLMGQSEWERFERNICSMFDLSRSAGIDISIPLTVEFVDHVKASCDE